MYLLLYSFYHSLDAVLFDIETIGKNCKLYNEAGSELVQEVEQMCSELTDSITALTSSQSSVTFANDSPSPIHDLIEKLFPQLDSILNPLTGILNVSLPPYLVTYCSRLYLLME